MPAPWSTWSVAPKTQTKHHQLHYSRNLALRILRQSAVQMVWTCTACRVLFRICHRLIDSRHQRAKKDYKEVVRMCEEWCQRMWHGWHWLARYVEGQCSALHSVASDIKWDTDSILISKSWWWGGWGRWGWELWWRRIGRRWWQWGWRWWWRWREG